MVDKELSGAPSVPHIGFSPISLGDSVLMHLFNRRVGGNPPATRENNQNDLRMRLDECVGHFSLTSSDLPRLKDSKVMGVADEDTPEEPQRQESIEGGCAGVLLGVCECEKGHPGEFEWADLQILRRHGRN